MAASEELIRHNFENNWTATSSSSASCDTDDSSSCVSTVSEISGSMVEISRDSFVACSEIVNSQQEGRNSPKHVEPVIGTSTAGPVAVEGILPTLDETWDMISMSDREVPEIGKEKRAEDFIKGELGQEFTKYVREIALEVFHDEVVKVTGLMNYSKSSSSMFSGFCNGNEVNVEKKASSSEGGTCSCICACGVESDNELPPLESLNLMGRPDVDIQMEKTEDSSKKGDLSFQLDPKPRRPFTRSQGKVDEQELIPGRPVEYQLK